MPRKRPPKPPERIEPPLYPDGKLSERELAYWRAKEPWNFVTVEEMEAELGEVEEGEKEAGTLGTEEQD